MVLIVLDGDKGHGISMKATPEVTMALPDMLENVARSIRAEWTSRA